MKSKLHWRILGFTTCLLLINSIESFAFREFAYKDGINSELNEATITNYQNTDKISGTVTDEQGKPLSNVSVTVKGTTIGSTTGNDGIYSLQVERGQTIVFSSIGFESQNIKYEGQVRIDVQLNTSSTKLEEVVAVGYLTQRKVDLTGAVSVVKIDNLKNSPTSNPIQSLQGLVPGLFITTSGNPTGAATVRIRGVNTLNNNDPLYIIDGVPTKSSAFQILNTNDIESIQVLKDASSAAIYGARSSNGVIIVTTKQAKKNKTEINFNTQVTQSKYVTPPPVLNTEERARVQWQATVNDGLNPDNIPYVSYDWTRDPNGIAILKGITIPKELAPGVPSANTNWFDAITRKGLIQEYNLSISTGGKNGGAFMSLGYLKNDYIAKFKSFEKISARVNSHYDILEGKIKIGENLTITNGIDNGDPNTNAYSESLQLQPILPVKLDNGQYSGPLNGNFVDHPNTLMQLDINKWDQRNSLNLFGNVYANISILKDLTLNTSFGMEHANMLTRDIERRFSTGFISRTVNSLRNSKSEYFNWNWNATLQYSVSSDKHKATFLAGTEAIKNNNTGNSTYRENFALETLDYFVEGAGSGNQTVSGSASGFSLLSYFGKVNYTFDNKYLISGTVRYDGSSRFGKNNRYGLFPAISAGWRLSEEKFIRDHILFVSDLKVRGGWGQTGNQEISNTARFGIFETYYGLGAKPFTYDNGTAYDIGGADSGPLSSGFRRIQKGNDNLKWETTTETNIGLDFGLFEQKVTGSFDYFSRKTSDILISPAYLAVQGEGGSEFVNGASVKTRGFEISLGYRNQIGALNYSLTGNLGHYNDKITDLPDVVVRSYPGNSEQTILGHSMNSIFGYVVDGIFQNQTEVDKSATQPGKGIGRIRYADLNGDGNINTLDQRYLGVSAPQYSYGLDIQSSYKGFSLRIFFQGVAGVSVNDARKQFSDFTDLWAGTNYGKRTLNAWTPSNSSSTIPAVTLSDNNNEGRTSTYFVVNGAYLKLREVSVGYLLNNVLNLKPIRLYITGENLLTVKDTSGRNAFTSPDPEDPGYGFPRPRKITIGLNLSF